MSKRAQRATRRSETRNKHTKKSEKSSKKSLSLFEPLMNKMEAPPPLPGTWGKWKRGEGRQRIEVAIPAVIRYLQGHQLGPYAELSTAQRADVRAFATKINIPNTTLRSYVQDAYKRHNGHNKSRSVSNSSKKKMNGGCPGRKVKSGLAFICCVVCS